MAKFTTTHNTGLWVAGDFKAFAALVARFLQTAETTQYQNFLATNPNLAIAIRAAGYPRQFTTPSIASVGGLQVLNARTGVAVPFTPVRVQSLLQISGGADPDTPGPQSWARTGPMLTWILNNPINYSDPTSGSGAGPFPSYYKRPVARWTPILTRLIGNVQGTVIPSPTGDFLDPNGNLIARDFLRINAILGNESDGWFASHAAPSNNVFSPVIGVGSSWNIDMLGLMNGTSAPPQAWIVTLSTNFTFDIDLSSYPNPNDLYAITSSELTCSPIDEIYGEVAVTVDGFLGNAGSLIGQTTLVPPFRTVASQGVPSSVGSLCVQLNAASITQPPTANRVTNTGSRSTLRKLSVSPDFNVDVNSLAAETPGLFA